MPNPPRCYAWFRLEMGLPYYSKTHTCAYAHYIYTCINSQRYSVHWYALYIIITQIYTIFKHMYWFTLWKAYGNTIDAHMSNTQNHAYIGTHIHTHAHKHTCTHTRVHNNSLVATSSSFLPFFQTLTRAISYNSWGCCIATGQTALATTTLSLIWPLYV